MQAIEATRRGIKELVDGTIRITVDVEPMHRAEFHRLFPEIGMPIAIAPLNPVALGHNLEPEPVSGFGQQAAMLHKSGFFYVPEVLKALGSDDEYREWIQRQPSCLTDRYSEYVDGEGRCVSAHVRRAGDSGTSYKAEYACVPLTDEEHQYQHQHGETDCLRHFKYPQGNHQSGPEWFDSQRNKYVQRWAHIRLCEVLGVDSLKNTNCTALLAWAQKHGLERYVPKKICE